MTLATIESQFESTVSISGKVHFVTLSETKSSLISYEITMLFQIMNLHIIVGLFSLFGILANIINIIVFVRQGFKDNINISFLGLAIADLACLIPVFWLSVCSNPFLENARQSLRFTDVFFTSGGDPHVCFNRISSLITAYITLERCLLINHPLQVKRILTPARTTTIIASIYVVIILLFLPFYFVNSLEWKFSVALNRTLLSHVTSANREVVESVTFSIHSVLGSVVSMFTIIVCTIILVVKLNDKTKWRQSKAGQESSKSTYRTMKDIRVVKRVIFISAIFIICLIPSTILFIMTVEPSFSYVGKYENILCTAWCFATVLETINSSVNIFVYFNTSSKFRRTFYETFHLSMEREATIFQ